MKKADENWITSFYAKFDFHKDQSYRIDVNLDNKPSIGSI